MGSGITLEQITKLPEPSWRLPDDQLFVQLGCISCPHKICFIAHGVTAMSPEWSLNQEAARDLHDLTTEIKKGVRIKEASDSTWELACDDVCADASNIQTVVELLNDRFGARLLIPE